MNDDPEINIEGALKAAREFETASDDAFSRGDVLHGSQFFRRYLIALRLAEDLAAGSIGYSPLIGFWGMGAE
jgi:hypothetical protein